MIPQLLTGAGTPREVRARFAAFAMPAGRPGLLLIVFDGRHVTAFSLSFEPDHLGERRTSSTG